METRECWEDLAEVRAVGGSDEGCVWLMFLVVVEEKMRLR